MTIWALVRKNLFRRKLRLFLTIIAIFVGFLLFGILQAVNAAFNAGVDLAAADRLVVLNKINFTQPMPYAYVNRVAGVEGVEKLSHQNWFGGYYQEPSNFVFSFAVDMESFLDIYQEYQVPPDQLENLLANRRGLIVGQDLADKYGWAVGDQIPLSSNIFRQEDGSNSWTFIIEAIYTARDESTSANSALLHYDYFNESRTLGRDLIGIIVLTTGDSRLNNDVAQRIDTLFTNSAYETETTTEEAFARAFVDQIGNISLIVTSVVAAAFFTILLIVGNTMIIAIRERIGEVAVMKTLGFDSATVFTMVVAEALVLSSLGGTLGLLTAFGLANVLSQMPQLEFLSNMRLDREILMQGYGLMILLGIITGIVPAWQALRVRVVAAFQRL